MNLKSVQDFGYVDDYPPSFAGGTCLSFVDEN